MRGAVIEELKGLFRADFNKRDAAPLFYWLPHIGDDAVLDDRYIFLFVLGIERFARDEAIRPIGEFDFFPFVNYLHGFSFLGGNIYKKRPQSIRTLPRGTTLIQMKFPSSLSELNGLQLRLTYFARGSGVVLHMPIGI